MNRRMILPFICVIFLAFAAFSTAVLAEDAFPSFPARQFHTALTTAPDDADQFEWVWQGGGDINGVFMIDNLYGWAAGSNLLLSTTDGGTTWQARDAVVGTNREYYDIYFVDRQTGWLVGKHGFRDLYWNQAVILHTTDGGHTWQEQLSGESYVGPLEKVQFIDANIGWAADYGDHFLRTTDGGANWTVVDTMLAGPFFFLDANTGWMTNGGNDVYHTTNGGITWSTQAQLTSSGFNSMWFTDANHGWMTGREQIGPNIFNGIIFATTDGGTTWTEQYRTEDLVGGEGLLDIVFQDTSTGWAVGGRGIIMGTTNGGSSWTPLDSGVLATLWSTQTVGGTAWAAGEGVIISSQDGGANWDGQGNLWPKLNGVEALDENIAWAVGDAGTVLHTTDAGSTWLKQRNIPKLDWNSVNFSSDNNGWVVGEDGSAIVTTDGGQTWSLKQTGKSFELHGVHFPVSIEGWAVGDEGSIMHTTDGGLTWKEQTSSHTVYDLEAVHFVDDLEGWIVGVDPNADFMNMHDGVLMHTTNGGKGWTNLGNKGMWDVDFVGSAAGWTVESNFNTSDSANHSFIHRTTDGGSTWVKIPNTLPGGFGRHLRTVDFVSPDNGWLGGNGLLRTGTGGHQWLPELELTGEGITDIAFAGPDDGWAVGADGLILHRQLKPTSPPACKSYDFNDDGIIDIDDINDVIAHSIFAGAPYNIIYDLVLDGVVDIADIFEVAVHFGESCPN